MSLGKTKWHTMSNSFFDPWCGFLTIKTHCSHSEFGDEGMDLVDVEVTSADISFSSVIDSQARIKHFLKPTAQNVEVFHQFFSSTSVSTSP